MSMAIQRVDDSYMRLQRTGQISHAQQAQAMYSSTQVGAAQVARPTFPVDRVEISPRARQALQEAKTAQAGVQNDVVSHAFAKGITTAPRQTADSSGRMNAADFNPAALVPTQQQINREAASGQAQQPTSLAVQRTAVAQVENRTAQTNSAHTAARRQYMQIVQTTQPAVHQMAALNLLA